MDKWYSINCKKKLILIIHGNLKAVSQIDDGESENHDNKNSGPTHETPEYINFKKI